MGQVAETVETRGIASVPKRIMICFLNAQWRECVLSVEHAMERERERERESKRHSTCVIFFLLILNMYCRHTPNKPHDLAYIPCIHTYRSSSLLTQEVVWSEQSSYVFIIYLLSVIISFSSASQPSVFLSSLLMCFCAQAHGLLFFPLLARRCLQLRLRRRRRTSSRGEWKYGRSYTGT